MSFKPEVVADSTGHWVSNAFRFATKLEAERYVVDLMMRWTSVTDTRVVESDDPVNYEIVNDELRAVKQQEAYEGPMEPKEDE